MPGAGNTQIINGQAVQMYTPAWYAAQDSEKTRQAQNAGTNKAASINALKGELAKGSGPANPQTGAVPNRTIGSGMGSLSFSSAGMGSVGSMGMPGGMGMGATTPYTPAPNVPNVAPIDTSAADRAIFARAKDQAGQTATGAMAGLRSQLAGRGMLGSGAEFRGIGNVANEGQRQLGDVTRQQAITDVGLTQDTAKTNYGGDITQRGQTISENQGQASLMEQAASRAAQNALAMRAQDITMRGQNISQQQAMVSQNQQSLQSLLSAIGSLY